MTVLIRALVWSTLFVALVLVFIPGQLSPAGFTRSANMPLTILGMAVATAGAFIAVWSIGSFVVIGKGTPAPFDPPRRLVTRGPYRFVRNPMYVGAGLTVIGAAVVYRSWILIGYVALLWAIVHLFVVFYEEPTLRRSFGSDYTDYCKRVRRWLPKLVQM